MNIPIPPDNRAMRDNLSPEEREELKELEEVCNGFEQQVALMMSVYAEQDARLVPLMLAGLTDILIFGLLQRFGREKAIDLLSQRINGAVLKMKADEEANGKD